MIDLSVLLFFTLIGSYLSWWNCFALLDIFFDCFYVCVFWMVVIRRSPFFVFVLFEQTVLVIIFIIWRVCEIHFQFNTSKKSFKSASSSFLLYTFGACIKFKFLFKSLYSALVNECLVKLIIFPFGSD